ncbi:Imm49 family immunity protein [Acinetobacter equi]|uniref:RNA polymerase subunit sigma n=1 Tax=Acinetobacter equi TaxID=1324350 RepID=A0A0N9W3I2_9GAMM|nr:Imm49 family immunity protein [Acinetobacter equi]ALH96250.1 RNA polymerase subunit sigma [Acinetobacter equi]
MQINMMCARREFKNAQQRFDHMTKVIKSYLNREDPIRKESLPYIQERKGNPFGAMLNMSSYLDGNMAGAWIFNKDLQTFKKLAYVYSKLSILKSIESSNPIPFFFRSDYNNVKEPMFHMLMSDSTEIRDFLIRNIEELANDTEDLEDEYDLNRQMIYNTLLMLEGKQLERLKQRSQKVIDAPTPKIKQFAKELELRKYDFQFYLAFAEQDVDGMKKALEPFFIKKIAQHAAKHTLVYYDFYLQPQVVIYAKLASMHGCDLGIDHEIAPKELIQYEPLPEEEYQDIVDFMKPYKFSYPYSYLQYWINYYLRKTDQLFPI